MGRGVRGRRGERVSGRWGEGQFVFNSSRKAIDSEFNFFTHLHLR